MKYSKPQLSNIGASLEVVESQGMKVQASIADSPTFLVATPNAYEADE